MSEEMNNQATPTQSPPEIWKQIPKYEQKYWASSRGRIKNARGRIMKQRDHESAGAYIYKRIDLCKNNQRKSFRVNRLVLMAFAGYPQKRIVARHIDGNTFNNNIENLKWGTQTDNILDFINRREEEWKNECRQAERSK